DGGPGSDTLIGGLGNDTYVGDSIGDIITENPGEGSDLVISSVSYSLGGNLEDLMLAGASDINGTGNDLDNSLTGNTGDNTLTGGLGDDTLDGGAGIDTMFGGFGDDTYFVNSIDDSVIENANEGTDTVYSSVSYALDVNVENLTLIESAEVNGTGNAGNNVLVGNAGNNLLSGGGGDDTLDGSLGDDVLTGGSDNDRFVFHAGFGNDTITDFAAGAGTDDVIEFHDGLFNDFSAVQAASTQVGSDVRIAVDTADTIILKNVSISELHQDDFQLL